MLEAKFLSVNMDKLTLEEVQVGREVEDSVRRSKELLEHCPVLGSSMVRVVEVITILGQHCISNTTSPLQWKLFIIRVNFRSIQTSCAT